jgi:uncharacterized protein (TIGR00369 family)
MSAKKSVDYFGVTVPFMEYIGLVPVSVGADRAVTSLALRKELTNSTGNMHGGMLMSALDFTMSAAARSSHAALGLATIDMTTSFFAPAATDLMVEARCLRRGKSIAFGEGEVRNSAGEIVAKASATFKLMRKAPAG